MILKKWDDLPNELKNEKTKEYYMILKNKKISLFLKRIFDVIMSLILLIILFPIFLIIAILIKVDSKGPVFYRQERITTYGKKFRIFKFRTMVQDADKKGALLTIGKDNRITRVGSKIRKCRLDEIPQIINIFIGDMSFVGTRPEVKKYVDMYTDEMKATLLMPAGVTSTASIEFKDEDMLLKNADNVDKVYVERVLPEKMKWNLNEVKKFSFFRELLVCIKTVIKVF